MSMLVLAERLEVGADLPFPTLGRVLPCIFRRLLVCAVVRGYLILLR